MAEMLTQLTKKLSVLAVIAVAFVAFFGISHAVHAEYTDDYGYYTDYTGSSYDGSNYSDTCYNCNSDYSYSNYDGYSDTCYSCNSGYSNYGYYDNTCYSCNSGYSSYDNYDSTCYSCNSGYSSYDNYDSTCYSCYTDTTCYTCYQPAPTPVDVCPNIAGIQTSVPYGMVKNANGNCVTPTPPVQVYCTANVGSANTGDTVTYTATASGGKGNYSYSWSGTDGLSGSGQSISTTYSSSGTKTATVTVTSGNKTQTANCQTYIQVQQQNNLGGYCVVDRTYVNDGEQVHYQAYGTGGNGNYSYSWSGTSEISGRTGSDQYVSYNSSGNKHAQVTISSGNQSITRNCQTVVVNEQNDLSVSCTVNPYSLAINQNASWSANVSGGNGNYYYSWSGTDGLYGNSSVVYKSYNTPGVKYGTVTVTSNGQTRTANCSTNIQGTINNQVTLYQTPNQGNLAALSSVYLSQVPYTGPTDTLKYVGYVLTLILASLVGTYVAIKRKAKNNRKAIIESFKQDNLARKGSI